MAGHCGSLCYIIGDCCMQRPHSGRTMRWMTRGYIGMPLTKMFSFESFEYDNPEPTGISLVFLSHPELNAAAVGRRLGISQSLMAQYINGTKKPSKERERMIMAEIANIGSELQKICA